MLHFWKAPERDDNNNNNNVLSDFLGPWRSRKRVSFLQPAPSDVITLCSRADFGLGSGQSHTHPSLKKGSWAAGFHMILIDAGLYHALGSHLFSSLSFSLGEHWSRT
jgi:hypothetical protein